jgi:hypothetical protein
MPANLKEKTVGLCGTWDNDASNDWQDINFKNHDLPNFVNSWVDTSIAGRTFRKFNFTNPNSANIPSGACNKPCNTKSPCDDEKYQGSDQLTFCGEMNQMAFSRCFEVSIFSTSV